MFHFLALYNGTLIGQLLHPNVSSWKDLSKEDLLNYKPVKRKAKMSSTFYNYKIIYPSHASLLRNIIEEINRMNIPLENASSVDAQAQIINMFVRLNKDAHYTGTILHFIFVTFKEQKDVVTNPR